MRGLHRERVELPRTSLAPRLFADYFRLGSRAGNPALVCQAAFRFLIERVIASPPQPALASP